MEVPLKKCKLCGEEKMLLMFNRNKNLHDGHANYCKECVKKTRKISMHEIVRQYFKYEWNKRK